MTKNEFVDQVAPNSGLGKGEAEQGSRRRAGDRSRRRLARGGEINFTGFGKFSVADRSARQGVNPQTGEKIQIAAQQGPALQRRLRPEERRQVRRLAAPSTGGRGS